jgi:hypothetical protein
MESNSLAMKPRARRITIGAAVLALVLVAVLAVAYWGTVRDHVEAWRFQLTREVERIEADPALRGLNVDISVDCCGTHGQCLLYKYTLSTCLSALANYRGLPLILDRQEELLLAGARKKSSILLSGSPLTADSAHEVVVLFGLRVLEQRFPRSAYVVIGLTDDELYQRSILWGGIGLEVEAE